MMDTYIAYNGSGEPVIVCHNYNIFYASLSLHNDDVNSDIDQVSDDTLFLWDELTTNSQRSYKALNNMNKLETYTLHELLQTWNWAYIQEGVKAGFIIPIKNE